MRVLIVALLAAISYAQTECDEEEAATCSIVRCVEYPASKAYCPCTCGSLVTQAPTPAPTSVCVESDLCEPSTCTVHPDEASWFCPCTCPGATPSGSSTVTGITSGTTTVITTTGGTTTSSSNTVTTTTGTSSSTGSTTTGSTSTGAVISHTGHTHPIFPHRPGSSTIGTSTGGHVFPGASGGFPGTNTRPGGFILNCELLSPAQCHGRTLGTNRFCMWHVRDGRCHDGNPNAPEDFCAQIADQAGCNQRAGAGHGAPRMGCCWDVEGYCDGFDAGDCGLPGGMAGVAVAGATAAMGSNPYGAAAAAGINPGLINGFMNGEFEAPEYERPEYERPEYELPEYGSGAGAGFPGAGAGFNQFTKFKREEKKPEETNASNEQPAADAEPAVEDAKNAETSDASLDPVAAPALKKTHQSTSKSMPKFLPIGVCFAGIIIGFMLALCISNFFSEPKITSHIPLARV